MPEITHLSGPEYVLLIYGSLAPGASNHHIISAIRGQWRKGTVRGKLIQITGGEYRGYYGYQVPGPSAQNEEIPVDIFFSEQLANLWPRLDEFEGEGYVRKVVPFRLDTGETGRGYIYKLNILPGMFD